MGWILGVLATTILLGLGWGWFHFIKGRPLPPAADIHEISIIYSENTGDLLPADYEPKEFVLKNVDEISRVLEHLGGVPISRVPLMDSDDTDEGPNWILNIYFEDGGFRFITVDKMHVAGEIIRDSALYQYLRNHYN